MNKETYDFQSSIHMFVSKIDNLIPSNWVIDPTELLRDLDKEDFKFYRIINSLVIYKLDLLDKYKDKILGHAMNKDGQDVILIQINQFTHFQLMAAYHPLDDKILGLKPIFLTKGGNDYETFINENTTLEHKPQHERRAGFGN